MTISSLTREEINRSDAFALDNKDYAQARFHLNEGGGGAFTLAERKVLLRICGAEDDGDDATTTTNLQDVDKTRKRINRVSTMPVKSKGFWKKYWETVGENLADVSPFDDGIAGADYYYNFQDGSFASQILDQSGNDYHLSKDHPIVATRGTPMRSTRSYSCHITGNVNSSNTFGVDTTSYVETGTGFYTDVLAGIGDFVSQIAIRINGDTNADAGLIGMTAENGDSTQYNYIETVTAGDLYQRLVRKNTQNDGALASGQFITNNVPYIITSVYNTTGREIYINGVHIYNQSAPFAFTWNMTGYPIRLGFGVSAAGKIPTFDIDHAAFWTGANMPNATAILAMHTAYAAEI
jgi:hypothetical protein